MSPSSPKLCFKCIMKVNVVSILELWSLSAAILNSLLGELCEIHSHSQIVFLLGASFMGLAPWPCQVRDCPLAKLNLWALLAISFCFFSPASVLSSYLDRSRRLHHNHSDGGESSFNRNAKLTKPSRPDLQLRLSLKKSLTRSWHQVSPRCKSIT